MIFYFSGTGNSLWVANKLSKHFDESLVSIADELALSKKEYNYTLSENERVFFVFPVHSWGPAILVMQFVQRLHFTNYSSQKIYAICTCGDECGFAADILKKALNKRNIVLSKTYSIQMPNNYILMASFNTDPKDLKEKKLAEAPLQFQRIVESIEHNAAQDIYTKGEKFTFAKSRMVYPLFRKFITKQNSFSVNKECCTSCELCYENCPVQIIHMKDGFPTWDSKGCVQCTACIHRCPVRAIEYGKVSQQKGRYVHPDV